MVGMGEGSWLRDRTAIVGIGHTAFGRRGEFASRGPRELVVEAVAAACADRGPSRTRALDRVHGEPVRFMARVVDADKETLNCGLPVRVDFERFDDEVAIPVFRVAAGA
jgi:acetyl-CoA acetyltransferase